MINHDAERLFSLYASKSGVTADEVDHAKQHFLAGWHAHAESLRQTDLFPGTLSANVAQPVEQLHCRQMVVGSIPSVGSITAEDIYAAYPRKVGRADALKAIGKILAVRGTNSPGAVILLKAVQSYAAAVAQWPAADKQYVPFPATWFNRGSYYDAPEEWVRGNGAISQFSKKYT